MSLEVIIKTVMHQFEVNVTYNVFMTCRWSLWRIDGEKNFYRTLGEYCKTLK